MYTPSAVTAQPEIQAAVDSVAADLKSGVRQIWWNIGQDWSGDLGDVLPDAAGFSDAWTTSFACHRRCEASAC